MRNYNIKEAQRILESQDSQSITLVNHVLDNWFERDYNLNYVIDCLINGIPLGIIKTRENRFKLIYPHDKISTRDLYIIIEIDEFERVSIITVYFFDKRRREREKENR